MARQAVGTAAPSSSSRSTSVLRAAAAAETARMPIGSAGPAQCAFAQLHPHQLVGAAARIGTKCRTNPPHHYPFLNWLRSLLICSLLFVTAFAQKSGLLLKTYAVQGKDGVEYEELTYDDPEFMWSRLPGRCCFSNSKEWIGNKWTGNWIGSLTCDECTTWGQADVAYCHASVDSCNMCGSNLYCDPPPELLSGNRVCVAGSKLPRALTHDACFDDYKTGVCMQNTIDDCNAVCARTKQCSVFVFYPLERMGSCVLCLDFAETEVTRLEATRAYTVTRSPPPPAKGPIFLNSDVKKPSGYYTVASPSPPPPPPMPPQAPPPPPRVLAHLNKDAKQHFSCTFEPKSELRVDTAEGYTDLVVSSRDECCNECGLHTDCVDFVFEPASGTCVLLPHVEAKFVIATPNVATTSGHVKITIRNKIRHGVCSFDSGSRYVGYDSFLGEPQNLMPDRLPVDNLQDCCDACNDDADCTKFSFAPDSKQCLLFGPSAERTLVATYVSGTVDERVVIDPSLHLAAHSDSGGTGHGGLSHSQIIIMSPPPSTPPFMVFRTFSALEPPPPHTGDESTTQAVVGTASMVVVGLFAAVGALCVLLCLKASFAKRPSISVSVPSGSGKRSGSDRGRKASSKKGRRSGRAGRTDGAKGSKGGMQKAGNGRSGARDGNDDDGKYNDDNLHEISAGSSRADENALMSGGVDADEDGHASRDRRQQKGAKIGAKASRRRRCTRNDDDDDDRDGDSESDGGQHDDGGDGDCSADGRSDDDEEEEDLPEGVVRVTLKTSTLLQKRDLDVSECINCSELRKVICADFSRVFKSAKISHKELLLLVRHHVQIGGRTASSDPNGDRWLLVTSKSDLDRVLSCGVLMLVDKLDGCGADDFEPAFCASSKAATAKRGARTKCTSPRGADAV